MTDAMDRDELIGLLGQLGDDNDQTVLAAARAVHAKVAAAGQTWDALLTRPSAAANDDIPSEADLADDDEGDAAPTAGGPTPDDTEALRLIERLLQGKEISEDLRRELEDYKADIAAGEFADGDRRYLKALHQRLSKS